MSWATDYAIEQIVENDEADVVKIDGSSIRLSMKNKPDVDAYICGLHEIDGTKVNRVLSTHPDIDFICGFRNSCIWHGDAIESANKNKIGWGNLGTLLSAVHDGNANAAEHKVFKWASDALKDMGGVDVEREYDRVFNVKRSSGTTLRLVMSKEYEPSADIMRSLWKRFGPFDVVYNIDPNVQPTGGGYETAQKLGIEILGHSEMFRRTRRR